MRSLPPVPFSAIQSVSSAEMQKKAAYSIIVRRGTRFEIPMNGSSWTFIGSSGSAEGIRYQNRKYETSKVIFVFDPVIVGEYLLEFTRQDVLLDDIESLFVRVIVEPEEGTATAGDALKPSASPVAPAMMPSASPAALSPAVSASPSQEGGTAAAQASSAKGGVVEDLSGLDGPALLKKANKEAEAGKAESAFAALDAYLARYGLGDEYLYWMGRSLELPGPRRDILKARSLYVQLMEEYPESARFDASDARIEYIDRRYLDIR